MKRSGLVIGALAVMALLASNFARPALAGDDADKQAINDVEHKLAAAPNADEAIKYYDSGDDVVLFDMAGPPREYTGNKAIQADLTKAFVGIKNPKVDFIELKIVTDGKLGYASSVQRFTATGPDGKPIDITFRQSDFLHKVDGQWKIMHQHISVPVDMKTGKSDMASKM
jgi:ketosteroid isomerase-like protein